MTPDQFIKKWEASTLKERSASQSHFNDLCALLGVETPIDADPKGEWYCFERGATKTAGGEGWADVWRRSCFGWEYKGKKKDLTAAYAQLQQYAVALENPPLLVVSDMDRIVVHTNWTNTVSECHEIHLQDLHDASKRDLLRSVFTDPERLKPKKTIDALTRDVADTFAGLAISLREAGNDPQAVAHFVNRLVFCMFAEDIHLLPHRLFSQILDKARLKPAMATAMLSQLFEAMRAGGLFGVDEIEWFNGGLFDDATALPLTVTDIKTIAAASEMDWSDIDPSIFGTLFERGLDPAKRSQLGAHYTDPEKIMMIVRPVIIEPLWREWEAVKAQIEKPKTADKKKRALLGGFLELLRKFRVLDPACGSGNFLYLALLALKDIEHRVNLEAEAMGLGRQFPTVGPEVVQGIELNPYAAELARVTIWIGEIQWMRKNGFDISKQPILKPLKNIENRDALLNADGSRTAWPEADVVIGNPPFLGQKFHRKGRPANKGSVALEGLGDDYANKLYAAYKGAVPASADLVSYWFSQVHNSFHTGRLKGFGLIATKSVGKGSSNKPLERLLKSTDIRLFNVWQNEPWVINGAEVRVAIICGHTHPSDYHLNGHTCGSLNSDLTSGVDISSAISIFQNKKIAFQGVKLNGPFIIDGQTARDFILQPINPNGRPNADVIKRFAGNDDVTMRDGDSWVIDFPESMSGEDASLYEGPFQWVHENVLKSRENLSTGEATESERLDKYWIMQRPRPRLRAAASSLTKVIAVPETSEHLIFRYLPSNFIFSGSLFVICCEDDAIFGVLSSRFHRIWARAQGNRMGVGNQGRYNATRTFETFPFPKGVEPNRQADDDDTHSKRISETARRLNELRENWLNPPDLIKRVPEVVAAYPDRIEPVGVAARAELKNRTLTNLYDARPAWLANAHAELDAAVAASYGWTADISEDEALRALLALNLAGASRK